jgi:predicted AAA+ superfamily ATPase
MNRTNYLQQIEQAFQVHPIVAILGPRQCGKTTVARLFAQYNAGLPETNYFDLEDPESLTRLLDPKLALSDLEGLIVIDEIQKKPELFQILRVLVDKPNLKQRYLILGSASRELIRQSSESLAGRIQYIELTPFNLTEISMENGNFENLDQLWLRGGFPKSYLANSNAESYNWRRSYVQTFLEQDIPNLGFKIEPNNIRRFWMMLTHYHGNICNYNELGQSLSLNHKTVRSYSDILAGTFMIRQLQPWHENIGKRQVKSHKIYFRDSGIFHSLLQIADKTSLKLHPKLGASWEGFALEEIIRYLQVDAADCYFWATHSNAELDLLVFTAGKRLGFEFKYTYELKITKSMHIAMADLRLDRLIIVNPSDRIFPLGENIYVLGLQSPLHEWVKILNF